MHNICGAAPLSGRMRLEVSRESSPTRPFFRSAKFLDSIDAAVTEHSHPRLPHHRSPLAPSRRPIPTLHPADRLRSTGRPRTAPFTCCRQPTLLVLRTLHVPLIRPPLRPLLRAPRIHTHPPHPNPDSHPLGDHVMLPTCHVLPTRRFELYITPLRPTPTP